MKDHNEKFLPYMIITGYFLYFMGGVFGGMVFAPRSTGQMVGWQIGNAGAICASVLAGALLTKQEWHLPSAGFVILGIVHSIFFSSLVMTEIDERIFATGAIILVPAIFLINFYSVFPIWLKTIGWLSCIFFLVMYIRMLLGLFVYGEWSQLTCYSLEQATMAGWCYYFWKTLIRKK